MIFPSYTKVAEGRHELELITAFVKVLHATSNIEKSLKNVKKLLKP